MTPKGRKKPQTSTEAELYKLIQQNTEEQLKKSKELSKLLDELEKREGITKPKQKATKKIKGNPCKTCWYSHECNRSIKNNTELVAQHCQNLEVGEQWKRAVKNRITNGTVLPKDLCDVIKKQETVDTMFNLN